MANKQQTTGRRRQGSEGIFGEEFEWIEGEVFEGDEIYYVGRF